MTVRRSGRGQTVLIKSDSPFFVQQCQALVCGTVLAASLNRSRLGPFEGPAIESPRLCRGIVTDLASDYIELGSTLEEKQSHLNVVCIAWNISILPKSARKMALTHFLTTYKTNNPDDDESNVNNIEHDIDSTLAILAVSQEANCLKYYECEKLKGGLGDPNAGILPLVNFLLLITF